MSTEKDLYFVAVKLFLRDASKLLITHDIFGDWDLPGGRIRQDEFNTPLGAIVERKIREELGPTVAYELGAPRVFFRVERTETDSGKRVRIFAIGYDAEYRGGTIQLGKHHDQQLWVDVATLQPEQYFSGGWLTGVQEFLRSKASVSRRKTADAA